MGKGLIGVIARELCDIGVAASQADSFACAFVLHQPYELGTGVALLSKRLRDLGLDEAGADETAITLVAVSLFTSQRNLADVGRLLRKAGVDRTTSRGAAMDAARIRREIRPGTRGEPTTLQVVWRQLAPALVFTGLATLLFVMAGRLG